MRFADDPPRRLPRPLTQQQSTFADPRNAVLAALAAVPDVHLGGGRPVHAIAKYVFASIMGRR